MNLKVKEYFGMGVHTGVLIVFAWVILVFAGCAPLPTPKVLTIAEQIVLDREKSESIFQDFSKKTKSHIIPTDSGYLSRLAQKLSASEAGFNPEQLSLKVISEPARFFVFPGTKIFLPEPFIREVEFENELAAALTFELAQVVLRFTATKLDDDQVTWSWQGKNSIFLLNRTELTSAIQLSMRILFENGYDPRSLPSFFQRYSKYFEFSQTEVEWIIRECHRARSEYLPMRDPIVRSKEFLEFKQRMRP